MFIILFDRPDRLGSNITNYLAQILFAHKNNYIIKFRNESKTNYRYHDSVFVTILFNYIDKHNEKLYNINVNDDTLFTFDNEGDFISNISFTLQTIKNDYIRYFYNNIYNDIKPDVINIKNKYNYIPFDVNKTILVHLRLDDCVHLHDYDGSTCSNYYKNKILNNEKCEFIRVNGNNNQAPLSKEKIENIINRAKHDFPDYKVILLTSPNSDTSFLNYEVIKNNDESLDLYLLTVCNVSILSRSTFALTSLFFNENKKKAYIPLWGHTACFGLDTIYDNYDDRYSYFY
jgi:hypothetical protein